MNNHQRGPKLAAILLLAAIVLSACQQSVSNAPLATPTLITPTGLFVTPLSGENPMQMIEEFAQGTAAAQTAAAGGATPTTPQAVSTTGTETTAVTTGATATATFEIILNTTPVVTNTPATPVVSTPAVVGTAIPAGPKPATYTLQKGEWPYCIARRFNVNPDELLNLSGLSVAQSNMLNPGQVLTIPQGSGVFPADRALHTHPTTYNVPGADTTLYAVACYFGDLSPEQIAAYNGLSVGSALTTGQTLNIP